LTLLFDMEGLPEFAKYVELAPKVATRAAKLAINQTTERKGLKLAREAMQAQVNFPRGYFNEIDSKTGYPRFGISYRATDTRLSAGIVAREAPTSLARFAVAPDAALRLESALTAVFFLAVVEACAPGNKNAVAQRTTAARRRVGRNRWLETR